jgi:hypothetical protein
VVREARPQPEEREARLEGRGRASRSLSMGPSFETRPADAPCISAPQTA